jgi:hypothetical protein
MLYSKQFEKNSKRVHIRCEVNWIEAIVPNTVATIMKKASYTITAIRGGDVLEVKYNLSSGEFEEALKKTEDNVKQYLECVPNGYTYTDSCIDMLTERGYNPF